VPASVRELPKDLKELNQYKLIKNQN